MRSQLEITEMLECKVNCNNPSENNSCARLKQHWLFSRTEAKYKFHNLKRSKQEMNSTYYRK